MKLSRCFIFVDKGLCGFALTFNAKSPARIQSVLKKSHNMGTWLRLVQYFFKGEGMYISPLSEEERKGAEEVKEKTLHILHDALKKRDDLLVEKPEEHAKQDTYPLISPNLVQDLIRELEKVTFMKNNNPEKAEKTIAYVYGSSSDRTIYLCPLFWKQKKYLAVDSQLGTLIHEVSHFLGYKDSLAQKTTESIAQIHRALTTYDIAYAFERYLSHDKPYKNNCYSCCWETSRDSVCQNSLMGFILRGTIIQRHISPLSEEERKEAEEVKERTLRILHDALKKRDDLLVEKPEELGKQDAYPLISPDLVQDLISELEKVTFMKDNNPEKEEKTVAYVYSSSSDRTIYLCPLFWKEKKYLAVDSQLGTLIHEVSHFLGYKDRHTENITESQAQLHRALTTYEIAFAFERYLNHDEPYENNYFSCCGETSRDLVCTNSLMALILRLLKKVGSEHSECSNYLWRNHRRDIYYILQVRYNRWTVIPKHVSFLSEHERKVEEFREFRERVLRIKRVLEINRALRERLIHLSLLN